MPTGLFFDEDALLKEHLQGLTVVDSSAPAGGRPVSVWFRMPEMEERQVTYPFVTIDLIDIAEATDRAHRGGRMVTGPNAAYRPPGLTQAAAAGNTYTVLEWPIALDLVYQLTTHARNALHDRQLMQWMWQRLPGRYGFIGQDGVNRPLTAQVVEYVSGDTVDEYGKRLFRKMYTVNVFTELWRVQVREVTNIAEISLVLKFGSGDAHLTSAAYATA